MNFEIIIWIALAIVSLIIEWITYESFMIWFAAGGIVAIIISTLGLGLIPAAGALLVVGIALLVTFRSKTRRRKAFAKMNAFGAIDRDYTLLTDITRDEPGTIKVNGIIWSVVTKRDGEIVPAGTLVRPVKIEGNKYVVEPVVCDDDSLYIVKETAPAGNKYNVEHIRNDEYKVSPVVCKQPKEKEPRKPFGQTKFALFIKKTYAKISAKSAKDKEKRVKQRTERREAQKNNMPAKKVVRKVVIKKVVKQSTAKPVDKEQSVQKVAE